MATLSGGQTIASVGLTAAENQQISTILQTITEAPQTVTVSSTSGTTVELPSDSSVLMGSFRTTSVDNQTITNTSGTPITVINTSAASSGSITNLIVDSSTTSALITGTGTGSVIGFIGGINTTVVVGDAGTQFIDMSQSTKNATIVSGTGNDSIIGGFGNDQVQLGDFGVANGGTGADTLIGGTGSATLGGGAGADSIVAATGGGVIIGEIGNDSLAAGAGKDIFIYRQGDGSDSITGFNAAADTLAFDNSILTAQGWTLNDVIARATVTGGNTVINLPDGSTITLAGVTGLNVSWFTIK